MTNLKEGMMALSMCMMSLGLVKDECLLKMEENDEIQDIQVGEMTDCRHLRRKAQCEGQNRQDPH